MKKTAQKKGGVSQPIACLGGLTANQFLREYWQKKPLLIRNAFSNFRDPLSKDEVLQLARRDDAESRIVVKSARSWELRHGPFSSREFSTLRQACWTVLIQDTQHFSHEAQDVLAHFHFIPRARIDDLMVSYAVPGAGVGAHVDSYDVFLLQGTGRRRWRISSQQDQRLKSGVPLKILAHFKAEQEFVLETGDMLYLPPGYAHHGIAESECLTWSIGFRAPSQQELSTALLDFLRDEVNLAGQYRDPDLTAIHHPGEIDSSMKRRVWSLLRDVQNMAQDEKLLAQFLGRYLTEPKSHVYFDAPEQLESRAVFKRKATRSGVALDLKTRFLYMDGQYFMNGTAFGVDSSAHGTLRQLADMRRLSAGEIASEQDASFHAALYRAHGDGYLHVA